MAKASTEQLDVQKELSILRKVPEYGQWLHSAIQRIEDAVNALGKNSAVAPKGLVPAPPQIQSLSVKTDGAGLVHAVISDANPIQKGIRYFVEYSTDSAFSQPHVVDLGASRTMNPVMLPAKDDDGNPQQFFFRGYSQYQGSQPGRPQHFGGNVPTAVDPGGSSQMTLLPSTGSGTAPDTGERGGSGIGKVLVRPTAGPKRVIAA